MAFACAWRERNHDARATNSTCIEGIGRANAEPGFLFEVVDEVVEVPDAASIAGMRLLERHLGRRYGGSSGTNRSEEHTSELQSLMRISYAVFCLKKKTYY